MSQHDCKYDLVIVDMKDDLKEVKKDVKSLLRFKWQIMGGAALIGAFLSLVVSRLMLKILGI